MCCVAVFPDRESMGLDDCSHRRHRQMHRKRCRCSRSYALRPIEGSSVRLRRRMNRPIRWNQSIRVHGDRQCHATADRSGDRRPANM